ncbi:MAG: sulfite exporter TauE/SafE family protein [Proteobacteria bacterium]|nr:sulfite exporter TauE/SafE family protein [Desulfobulbaceae bacterium]MBU4153372.1 sulfite exporter TauE/SafE family protein [Pseudomonadota bacterium]
MKSNPIYTMALMTGFLGSAHCLGMCGGLITALSMTMPQRVSPFLFLILYHGGRIATYSIVGVTVGWLGSVLAYANSFHGVMRLALIGSDLFIIAAGLGTAGLFSRLTLFRLESSAPATVITRIVGHLPSRPEAITALPLGLLMGFLPCGFSYAMAITAAQTTSPLTGGLTMLVFGLGTTPALFVFGSAIGWLNRRPLASPLSTKTKTWMARIAGLMVAGMGGYHLIQHIQLLGWTFSGPLGFLCH